MKRLTEKERALILNALQYYREVSESSARMSFNRGTIVLVDGVDPLERIRKAFDDQAELCRVLAAQFEQADGIGLEGISG